MLRIQGIIFTLFCLITTFNAKASYQDLLRLKKAYPEFITSVSNDVVTWNDGTKMPVNDSLKNKTIEQKLNNPSLYDQVNGVHYQQGIPANTATFAPINDPGRIRYEPFFRKMYGDSSDAVQKNLTTIYWMSKFFGNRYPLQVTKINGVDKKLLQVSHNLEDLLRKHPEYRQYLENPGGTFKWRFIANTNRLSAHSFGMTIDINSKFSNYWQWDLQKEGKPISESTKLIYRNAIPWEIIPIFEEAGFIWGGKWYHYDTMHFEYRPELLLP